MAKTNEQVKPLAPSAFYLRSDEDHEARYKQSKLNQRRYLLWCGCLTVLLLIPVVTVIVILTAFHIKSPSIKMNSISIQSGEFVDSRSRKAENITLLADVSVKNPNVASFKFSNSTATIYFGGMVVGEGRIPPGLAKAKKTLRMNVSVDIIPEKLLDVPSYKSAFSSKELNMRSYTIIHGRVKVIGILKKSLAVKLNCTISYNLTSQTIREHCKRHG